MKAAFILAVFAIVMVVVHAGGNYVIPDQFKAEGDALMKELEDANVPKLPDGSCYDICKAPDALKTKSLAFVDKVNANGGQIPKPNC
uniref:CSON006204 protein n=1 Tax=Culicoides sonorensis TaxID=179676 RepID=A0A336MUS7_CULSO